MSVTIYDVAQKAGVSISTVSRVLNNNPNVLEDTRQKVLKAIQELQFKPNPIARGLVVNQTNLIEVCFSWSGYQIDLQYPWYIGILNGINEVVQENQFGLLINTISGIFDPKEVYRRVFHNAVDGVLMVSPYLPEEGILQMKHYRVPMLFIGCRLSDPEVDFVDSDNVRAAVEMTDHFVGLGHRRIAFITGETETSRNAADRLSGFRQAMKKHGLPLLPDYVLTGNFLRESGIEAMKKLLSLKERPTAVFASNDMMALGAWDTIQQAGLKAGEDIALAGFDDVPEVSAPPYSLTTMRQDYRAISTQATRILLEKIRHPEQWKTRQVLVPTQLVVRASSGSKRK